MGGGPSGESSNDAQASVSRNRTKSFKSYGQQRKAAEKGIDVMITSEEAKTVRPNISLAMDLEEKARKGQINVPIPTVGSVALNTISTLSARQQAEALRQGGTPVFDQGEYKGVVSTNFLGGRVYSGDPAFDPIGGGPNNDDNNSMVTQRPDITPERTAEVTPEVIPNDEPITTRYARKRTRRAGQGGTILEGYGVLTRPASKRSVT